MKNLGEYHDFHVQNDTSLWCDVFEIFRIMCVNIYEHDPAKPISTLGLARQVALTLFRMGFFGTTHGNKIRHTYPTMIKLGTVIPYLRKIQKMYEPCDTFLDSCRHQHLITGNQKILPHQEVHI